MLYGVTLYGERFTVATAAGLALIVVGSWLAAEGRPPGGGERLVARRQLPAGGVDIAPAREPHGGAHTT